MHRTLMIAGRRARRLLAHLGSLSRLQLKLARSSLALGRLNLRLIGKIACNQILFTGLEAAPLVAVIAASIGAVSIIQSANLLTGLADDLIGALLVSVIVRELGPLVAAVILIGRSGTAMATELGSMRLSGEIEALKAYRIDPLDFVILPRVLGMVLSLFALTVLFDLVGVLGGFGISLLIKSISFALLKSRVMSALTNGDLVLSALKALLFGEAIAVLSCYFGLRVQQSPTELPQAVTRAVVASMTCVILLDGLAAAFYLL